MTRMKYAVVNFFERNEVEIIETRHIITDENCNREDMNGENWDADREVQVPWPLNKGKNQQKYVARILRFGSSIGELAPYRKAAELGRDVPLTGEVEYGRGQRAKQPKRLWESETEESDEDEEAVLSCRQQNKKKKATRNAINEEAKNQLKSKLALQTQDEATDLQVEVLRLREENQTLKNVLAVMKGLPEMLELMEKLRSTQRNQDDQLLKKGADHEERQELPVLPATQMLTPVRNSPIPPRSPAIQTASVNKPSSPVCTPVTPSTPVSGHLRKVFGYDVNDNGQVDLGYGICTTYMACEVVFTREELASSSLTGKRSNAFKDAAEKPQLDKNKVSAVVDFVKRIHGSCEEAQIRKLIAIKINIVQKLEKRKMKITE